MAAEPLRGVRAVLFDLDNTLFDHTRASREALAAMGEELEELAGGDADLLCREFERHNDDCWALAVRGEMTREELRVVRFRRTLTALGLELAAERVSDAYLERYGMRGTEVPGASATVLQLLDRIPVGVVTNGFADLVDAKLEAIGLARVLHPVVVA
ncbi:MAG: HAD family hydrolase, partial [Gemmatimonadota bacterium]